MEHRQWFGARWSAIAALAAALLTGTGAAATIAADHPAQRLVHEATDRLFAAIGSDPQLREKPERLHALVNRLVVPHFDFDRMAMRVLGKNWRGANGAQRAAFIHEFQTLLLRTYATALSAYAQQKVNYLPTRARAGEDQVTVRTAVEAGGPVPVPVHYSMHADGGKWRVHDITIEGVSLVVTYRASFGTEVRSNGIDGLIERLRKKNAEERDKDVRG